MWVFSVDPWAPQTQLCTQDSHPKSPKETTGGHGQWQDEPGEKAENRRRISISLKQCKNMCDSLKLFFLLHECMLIVMSLPFPGEGHWRHDPDLPAPQGGIVVTGLRPLSRICIQTQQAWAIDVNLTSFCWARQVVWRICFSLKTCLPFSYVVAISSVWTFQLNLHANSIKRTSLTKSNLILLS